MNAGAHEGESTREADAARDLDVLVPTCGRPDALAVTLGGLAAQTVRGFRVVVSDQTPAPDEPSVDRPACRAVMRVLRLRGSEVELHRGRPWRGMAEQRDFLLSRARATRVLFLDDDILCEPRTLSRMLAALGTLRCGFVGAAPQGLSFLDDVRPAEWAAFEPVAGPPGPERVRKGMPSWQRWRLHNAANLTHLTHLTQVAGTAARRREWTAYRVAWIAGCVLYDRVRLQEAGGFGFWTRLPPGHRGEDVVAALRVLERSGGVGILPPGTVHLELPTTLTDRRVDAYAEIIEADDAGLKARHSRRSGGEGL
ncbi:glycosyltransferase family 2 protein [Parafrankia sp. EUN1f]|uniref:glycosyltransferase family 2 protein n=1 Tax=Parafrankia sp. EUN1f TaxID=102897 RepID=UPI0001C43EB1|nr:glycosyltransferase family 2 protein [Parafrankia sp. EUN1f]EFC84528.1 glycosyl transferase family 2 [Parafrankia sp. EUN1f]